MTKTDASWIAFAQKLITARKIMNPFQLHKVLAEEYPSKVVSYATAQAAAKKLTFAPGGRNYSPAQKMTDGVLVSLQAEIDAGDVSSTYAAARLPRAVELGISQSTIQTALSRGKLRLADKSPKGQNRILSEIARKFSPSDLKVLAATGKVQIAFDRSPMPTINFKGDWVSFLCISDTHCGSIYYKPEFMRQAKAEAQKARVNFVAHLGDATNGNRHTTAEEVDRECGFGFENQADYTTAQLHLLNDWPLEIVSGNHDRWYQKDNDADIVKVISERLVAKGMTVHYRGHDEGDVSLGGRAILRLWHGEDGSSYAISYRIQKIVESWTGGEKPNLLCAGHAHKSFYTMERHVHCYSGGAMSTQSRWMRSKRLSNHSGFWIIRALINKDGVAATEGRWHPFYW